MARVAIAAVVVLSTLAFMLGCGGNASSPSPTTPTASGNPAPTGGTAGGTGGTPGGGSGGMGGSTTPPPPPPPGPAPSAVSSTSPKAGDTCVGQNPKIQVHFNAGSAPSNVTTDNFKVTGPFGEEAGLVTWDASSNTATWQTAPHSSRDTAGPDLGMASNFTATISGFSGGPYSQYRRARLCGGECLWPE